MKNIKNSNFEKIFKPLNIGVSIILHLVLLLYPLKFIIDHEEKFIKEEPKEEVIQIQLLENYNNIKFSEVINEKQKSENKINDSNILSNKTITIKEKKISKTNSKKEMFKNNGDNDKETLKTKNENVNIMSENDGEKTSVSTVKFKYFDYYVKIKNKIEYRWKNRITRYINDLDIEENTFKTVLILKVDREGLIANVSVGESSGSEELDKIAINTFKDIRIPMPPKDIFNSKKYIYLYWGFAVKI